MSEDTYIDEDGRVRQVSPETKHVKEIIRKELEKIDEEESNAQ